MYKQSKDFKITIVKPPFLSFDIGAAADTYPGLEKETDFP